jgi:hypothetical protein
MLMTGFFLTRGNLYLLLMFSLVVEKSNKVNFIMLKFSYNYEKNIFQFYV